ncbi:uncharacterized protein DMAD_01877 [Drosophila madeirensis]|uniref:Uncharacterized protein n=1 Tax=Drosophila madeirensis TaxID=30013 RepID=A0AAU9G383_DROMD
MAVSVPPPGAHWTMEFRDTLKPLPQDKVAKACFKVIRFLYPPFAIDMVDVIPVVNDPQPDFGNIFLALGIAFVLGLLLVYVIYRRKFPLKPSPPIEDRQMERRGFWDDPIVIARMPDAPIPARSSGGTTGAEYLRTLDMHSRQAAESDNEDRVYRNVSEEDQPGVSHVRSQSAGPSAGPSSGPSAGPSSGPTVSHSCSSIAGPSAAQNY